MDDLTVKIVALVRAQISLTTADEDFRRFGTDRQRRNLIIASDSYGKAIVELDKEIEFLRHLKGHN